MLTPVNINRQAVDEIIRRFGQCVNGGQFSLADIVIATAEFTGRLVVSATENPVQGFQFVGVLGEHVKTTLIAGFSAKGFNMGGAESDIAH